MLFLCQCDRDCVNYNHLASLGFWLFFFPNHDVTVVVIDVVSLGRALGDAHAKRLLVRRLEHVEQVVGDLGRLLAARQDSHREARVS